MKKTIRISDLEHIPSHVFCENIEQIVAQVEELRKSFLIDHYGKEYLLCPVEEEQVPSMSKADELVSSILDAVLKYNSQYETVYERFLQMTKLIEEGPQLPDKVVRETMDLLLDFISDPQFTELYKRICHEITKRYPQLATDAVCMAGRSRYVAEKETDKQQRLAGLCN
nr:hypothetical protein [Clostridia bacterium]